jgi:hypothetical protein
VIWRVLDEAGFAATARRVLEPGCGAGTFIGLAPPGAQVVGVELDPVTAAIVRALYPAADIRAESFADTRLPAGSVDLTIGNVLFGQTVLTDRRHNPGGHSMHNHFIIKSLHLTRPGGVVAVLTSRWTLDATNPAARREIGSLAELVTAVRLPSTAHERAAGTRVVTDLLVLRRHSRGNRPDRAPDWETTTVTGGGTATPVSVNTYFRTHPDQVVGDLHVRTGQYGPELDVRYPGDVAEALYARLAGAVAGFTGGGPLFTPPTEPAPEPAPTAPAAAREGHLAATSDGRFTVVVDGQLEPHQVPASQAPELRALLGLRDTVVALLAAEAATAEDTAELDELRHRLGTRYDGYVTRYGPLNRVTVRRTGRVDPDTGEERTARIRPPQGRFRDDPHSPAVYALEHYDAATGTATRADLFRERVILPRAPRLGADSPADAVAICLDTHGEVRLPEIARLLGTDQQQARDALGALVYDDPTGPARSSPPRSTCPATSGANAPPPRPPPLATATAGGRPTSPRCPPPSRWTCPPARSTAGSAPAGSPRTSSPSSSPSSSTTPASGSSTPAAPSGRSRATGTPCWRPPPVAPAGSAPSTSPTPPSNSGRSRSSTNSTTAAGSSTSPRPSPPRRRSASSANGSPTGSGRTPTEPANSPAPTTRRSTRSCCAPTTAPAGS